MSARYEWVMGPTVVTGSKGFTWHAARGERRSKGTIRLLVGQIRDTSLGIVLTWTVAASPNMLRAKGAADDYAALHPRAADWMPRTPDGKPLELPRGWTLPRPGAPFEQGIVA